MQSLKQTADPELWLDQYGDYLYRFALSRVQNPATAEDLVQETFLAALGSRGKFQGRSSVRTWLVAILRHKIVDHIRKSRREQLTDDPESAALKAEELFDQSGHWKILPAKWVLNPAQHYQQKEFIRVLYQCLAELSPRQANAFVLREIEGLSTAEICKELEITPTNSWVILYRARIFLRRCLGVNWFGAAEDEGES